MRKMCRFLVLFPAFTVGLFGEEFLSPHVSSASEEVAKLQMAASQHEIIFVWLANLAAEAYKGHSAECPQVAHILSEFKKILQLGFRGEKERLLVLEAWLVAQECLHLKQYSLAHQIVDETLSYTENAENKFSLLMLKGKIFKDQKHLIQAIETYRQAQEFAAPR